MAQIRFRVLGSFEVLRDDQIIAAGGGRRHAVLVVLLMAANRVVQPDQLRQAVWPAGAPRSAENLIHGYVSDWRQLLDPDRPARSSGTRLVSSAGGYLVRVQDAELDAAQLNFLTRAARSAADKGDLRQARRHWLDAVALRRGPPLRDFPDLMLDAAVSELDEAWLNAVEAAAELEVNANRPDSAWALVQAALAEFPMRERLVATGMLAHYRAQRQADALALFEDTRRRLAEELGVDPDPALRSLHRDILRQSSALRAAPARTHSPLPKWTTSFVGRENELASIADLLTTSRLVTLVGPGGAGKTRVAAAAAAAHESRTGLGSCFVDLSAATDTSAAWRLIMTALGIPTSAELAPQQALAIHMTTSRSLIVLDNMEHLPDMAHIVTTLISARQGAVVLGTSRRALGLQAERLISVDPLPVPQATSTSPSVARSSPALTLFLDRAAASNPAFVLGDDDLMTVTAICRRLDGLPLAIELAAPWTRMLSVRALLERLDRPMQMLVAASPADRPHRHHTMRAAIQASYDALSLPHRQILQRLSVAVSGCRLDALESTAPPNEPTLELLTALVDWHLVDRVDRVDVGAAEPRFRLLETIRSFVLEQLATRADILHETSQRHCVWVASIVAAAAVASRSANADGPLQRLAEEQAEVRTALTFWNESGQHERVLSLSVDALPLWWDLGAVDEGYRTLAAAIAAAQDHAEAELRAGAGVAAAILAGATGHPIDATFHARQTIDIASALARPDLVAAGQGLLGNELGWADWAGAALEARSVLDAAYHQARASTHVLHRWGWCRPAVVATTAALSMVDILRDRDPAQARAWAMRCLDDTETDGDDHTMAFAFRALGFLDADHGLWVSADDWFERALNLANPTRSVRSRARTIEEQARAHRSRDLLDEALRLATTAATMSRDAGHIINWIRCATLIVDIACDLGDVELATHALDELGGLHRIAETGAAQRMLVPRRARCARLSGRPQHAAHHLAAVAGLEAALPLSPERLVFLVETAAGHLLADDHAACSAVISIVMASANALDRTLPHPEAQRLQALTTGSLPD